MNDPRTAGTPRLTSGFLLFKRTGETNYIDLGNILEWEHMTTSERAERMVSEKGFKRRDRAWTKAVKYGYKFTLDEFTEALVELKQLGRVGTDYSQSSATGSTAQFTAVQGRSYSLGAFNVTSVVVEVSASAKTLDVDYTLDAVRGIITIISGGGIADAATVDVTFNKPAKTFTTINSADGVYETGDFIFDECDQESTQVRARHTFSGSIFVDAHGSNNLDNPTQVSVTVDCHSKPVIIER